MDARNFESGAIATPPPKPTTPSVGYATNGNGTNISPTVPGAFYFHKIAEEMNNVITGAGLTPDDDALDQFWQSIQLLISPTFVGNIATIPIDIVPSGYLECDGSAISRTSYPELFALIGTTFGAGDGSTTFNLPDLRGEFIRGWDHGRGIDIGRLIGTNQLHSLENHTHWSTGAGWVTNGGNASGGAGVASGSAGSNTVVGALTNTLETRPRNITMMYCIKY